MKRGDISNNNRPATKLLVKAGMQYHKGRYCILAAAAALGILVLCTVFSIAFGKVEAEYLQSVRGAGTAATTYLEGGSMEQYHAIEALDYIRFVGREKSAGGASQGETYVAALSAVDLTGWEELMKPAYTHIKGHYPEKEEEIMLSFRALKTLGIQKPKEGMKLELTVFLGNREIQEEFALCGWYQEYREPSVFPPNGYVSQEKLEAWGMSLEEPDRLLLQQKDLLDGYAVEEKLYRDIPTLDSAQQFLGENTFLYSVMEEFTGGFYMAAFCGMLVLLVIFFLIQNVLGISMQKDIRQIGLLDTLGATQKQLRKVYFCQSGIALLVGSAVGLGASFLTVFFVVPKILGNLYLYHFGKAADLLVFHPEIFVFSLLFMTLVILGASVWTVHKATALSPLEAFHYLEMDRKALEGSRTLLRKKKAQESKEVPGNKKVPGNPKSTGKQKSAGKQKSTEKQKGAGKRQEENSRR